MKRIGIFIALMIIAATVFAQRGRVTSALSYKETGELEKAWELIQEASDPNNEKAAKSIDWPRTYEVKGGILQEIYRMGKTGIVEQPLFKAFDAYKKAIELDKDGRSAKSLAVALTFLQTDLTNNAITAFEQEKYDIALQCFERYMEISNMPLINKTGAEVIDTAIIFNSGLSAFKAEDFNKAKDYFLKSAKYNYNSASSYHYAYQASQELGDSLKSVDILKDGFEKHPDSEILIVELINFYISSGKADDAIIYLDKAIEQNPENVTFYTAKGSSLEKMGKEDEAIKVYKQAIEMDENAFTPYYNLGVIFFNRGVSVMNEASQLPPSASKEYEEKFEEGKKHLKEALPYFEKAYELNNQEIAILESLRLIYYRLQMNEKYEEVSKKIQSVKGE
ncbi:MAG TPA: tetratricopeptide repeat protein [Prolixibacteraceae bacterium]|nr:tetratricopeptide repeat protein [Prolixibacteraceae bacterium]